MVSRLKNRREKEKNSDKFDIEDSPMASAASKYQTLRRTVDEWSSQSGELPSVILRRICDWAICRGFAEGAFVLPTGHSIDLLELHRAMRMAVGEGATINKDLAIELLHKALVSKDDIKDFCERVGVDPPASLSSLRSIFRRLLGKARFLGPPDCPNINGVVAKLEAKSSAVALINTMKSQLPRASENSDFANAANERWFRYAEYAQLEADASGDLEIQSELAALRQQWEIPAGTTNEAATAESPVESASKRRGRGRPQGSGSLESEDSEIVEGMHSGLLSGKFTSISAAARAFAPSAGGGGTPASIEARLRKRYAERYPG